VVPIYKYVVEPQERTDTRTIKTVFPIYLSLHSSAHSSCSLLIDFLCVTDVGWFNENTFQWKTYLDHMSPLGVTM
jgi:hypothetical protein